MVEVFGCFASLIWFEYLVNFCLEHNPFLIEMLQCNYINKIIKYNKQRNIQLFCVIGNSRFIDWLSSLIDLTIKFNWKILTKGSAIHSRIINKNKINILFYLFAWIQSINKIYLEIIRSTIIYGFSNSHTIDDFKGFLRAAMWFHFSIIFLLNF